MNLTEPAAESVFQINGAEIAQEFLRIGPDGRFFVKGVEVETNEEVRDAFLAFAKSFGQAYENEKLRQEIERLNTVIFQAHAALDLGCPFALAAAKAALTKELP